MNTVPYQVAGVWREAVAVPGALARTPLPLPLPTEVFLWRLDLSTIAIAPLLACLTKAERRRDAQWKYRRDFELSLRCRGTLRMLLGWHTGEAPSDIAIVAGAGGKPELGVNPLGLHFSVARCGTQALIALGRTPLGVDLVSVRQEFSWRVIARHWFHEREQDILAAAPKAEQPGVFFQIWTHKEACAKAVGGGVERESMASFFVTVEGGATHRPEKSWQLWHLRTLEVPDGYKASLAHQHASPVVLDRTTAFAASLEPGL